MKEKTHYIPPDALGLTEEQGLFYPDGSYSPRQEIRRKLLAEELDGTSRIVSRSDFPGRWDFETWTKVMTRRQEEKRELLGIPEHIEVEIESASPILVGLFGDSHLGGGDVDHQRLATDVSLLRQADGYSITVGDLTDSYFFMPEAGEQIASGEEQVLFAQAALDRLAEDGKLIAGFGGDHDMWAKDKGGAHTLYHQFHQAYEAHYLEGVSYITLRLTDGNTTIPYRMIGSHRHKGFSIYNDVHASWRQYNDEAKAETDIISFTAHNHTKGYLRQVRKVFGGGEINIHAISLGTYKESDRYSRKMGWPRKAEQSKGAFGLILHPDVNRAEIFWTMEEAVQQLSLLT